MKRNRNSLVAAMKHSVAKKIKPGDCFFLPASAYIWYTRSDDDVSRLYEDDRINGDTIGDDGESRVYSRQGSARLPSPTGVIITRLNGVEWHGWGKKPVGLVVATVTTGPYIGRTVAVYRCELKIKM
jgi:hypothetical protein